MYVNLTRIHTRLRVRLFFLQDNKLTSINPLVGNLDRLVVFNAGNNQVESIPPQLGNCVGLTMLGSVK